MKEVRYTDQASRELRAIAPKIRAQIETKLARYAATGAGDVKALVGQPWLRLRSGDWRVIFSETDTTIDVVLVGHRGDVYR